MQEGRKDRRIAGRSVVRICAVNDPSVVELTTVENVSVHGARAISKRYWEPGTHVEVKSASGEFLRPVVPKARARVVYCYAVDGIGFAVGLDFLSNSATPDVWSMPLRGSNQ
jgi:hypothetical protein